MYTVHMASNNVTIRFYRNTTFILQNRSFLVNNKICDSKIFIWTQIKVEEFEVNHAMVQFKGQNDTKYEIVSH